MGWGWGAEMQLAATCKTLPATPGMHPHYIHQRLSSFFFLARGPQALSNGHSDQRQEFVLAAGCCSGVPRALCVSPGICLTLEAAPSPRPEMVLSKMSECRGQEMGFKEYPSPNIDPLSKSFSA